MNNRATPTNEAEEVLPVPRWVTSDGGSVFASSAVFCGVENGVVEGHPLRDEALIEAASTLR